MAIIVICLHLDIFGTVWRIWSFPFISLILHNFIHLVLILIFMFLKKNENVFLVER